MMNLRARKLVCCLAALMLSSEASAGGLFPGAKFPVGDKPYSVVVADLDGDNIPDLVTANVDSDDVSVLLGNGDGSFQTAVSFAAGDSPPGQGNPPRNETATTTPPAGMIRASLRRRTP